MIQICIENNLIMMHYGLSKVVGCYDIQNLVYIFMTSSQTVLGLYRSPKFCQFLELSILIKCDFKVVLVWDDQ